MAARQAKAFRLSPFHPLFKYAKNVIILYIKEQRITLSLDFDHSAVLIIDAFKSQMTESVKELLSKSKYLWKRFQQV